MIAAFLGEIVTWCGSVSSPPGITQQAAMLRSVGSHADSHVDAVQWSRLREQSPALERVCGNGGDPREGQVCRAPCWKQAEGSEQILALPNNPPPGFPDTVITL